MSDFLFEIGAEEIPAGFLPPACEELKESMHRLLEQSLISHGEIRTCATARRLTVIVHDIAQQQKDSSKKVVGPPVKAAFDKDGKPTKACYGFAKSQGVDVKSLMREITEKGEYVAAHVEQKGEKTEKILAQSLPEFITNIHFPKSMRWGEGSLRFARPIHWIMALFDKSIITISVDGIKSSSTTRGHRFLSNKELNVDSIENYFTVLEENYVLADQVSRQKKIEELIEKSASEVNGIVHKDDELMETVTYIVEYPVAIVGSFDSSYLELPKELLITVMKSHQKFFSLEDEKGDLIPYFITISNTQSDNNDTVRVGAERVIRARLEDARFYYEEDRKKALKERVDELRKVTFQEKLGSIYDKVKRMADIADSLGKEINYPHPKDIQQACFLSKADLVTGVVREFPELQGYMGLNYALSSGESYEVSTAVYEHYMPRFAGDLVPGSDLGALVSLADKIDTIVCFFSIGLIPSGSVDPYALRRQAIGIISILSIKEYPFSLHALINNARQRLERDIPVQNNVKDLVSDFFRQRLEGILQSEGYRYDSVNAVLATGEMVMKTIHMRLEELKKLKEEPRFQELLIAAKRAYNILKHENYGGFNPSLLTEEAEKQLSDKTDTISQEVKERKYHRLFDFIDPINRFFDTVLVMDKDADMRNNRLALLTKIRETFNYLADFSFLEEH
jgi:glycyl-tRNA synthetase beta chain